eukprot:scaffold38769_cov35-Tisochrysis_lutea.AAC.8
MPTITLSDEPLQQAEAGAQEGIGTPQTFSLTLDAQELLFNMQAFSNAMAADGERATPLLCGDLGRSLSEGAEGDGSGQRDRASITPINMTLSRLASAPECVICSALFTHEDEAIELPCSHVFHGHCARTWLTLSATCPICRAEVDMSSIGEGRSRGGDQTSSCRVSPPLSSSYSHCSSVPSTSGIPSGFSITPAGPPEEGPFQVTRTLSSDGSRLIHRMAATYCANESTGQLVDGSLQVANGMTVMPNKAVSLSCARLDVGTA